MPSLDDLMRDEEAHRLARARAEIAAEKAAWEAFSPEQKAAHVAAAEARFADVPDEPEGEEHCPGCGDPDCDFDCDGEYS
jgi:hypothetical protein